MTTYYRVYFEKTGISRRIFNIEFLGARSSFYPVFLLENHVCQPHDLHIGRDLGGTPLFTGEVDDVGYWTRALTSGEIFTMYERLRVANPP